MHQNEIPNSTKDSIENQIGKLLECRYPLREAELQFLTAVIPAYLAAFGPQTSEPAKGGGPNFRRFLLVSDEGLEPHKVMLALESFIISTTEGLSCPHNIGLLPRIAEIYLSHCDNYPCKKLPF